TLANQHQTAAAELESFARLERELREATREREHTAKERESGAAQLVKLERERTRREARLAALQEELARHAKDLELARAQLEPILGAAGTWLPQALADPETHLQALTRRVEEYQAKQLAKTETLQRTDAAGKAIQRTTLELGPLEEQRQRCAKEITRSETELEKRHGLLTEALHGSADPESLAADLVRPLERSLQTLENSAKGLEEHQESKPEELAAVEVEAQDPLPQLELIQARLQELRNTARKLSEETGKLGDKLDRDQNARDRHKSLLDRIEAQREAGKTWATLDKLLGSANGARLREFAQGLTLDAVLQEANLRLKDLSGRYTLERIPGEGLELRVIDREMADEIRPIRSLSGGESFLTSLALALGLAALSSRRTRIESLFIDEGFGTLDPATLDSALSTLEALQGENRRVGIISHAAGMADRVGARIEITPLGSGYSSVEVHGT
ncbi:MAG: exonuclease SbcC, partial [Planctomycetota bacterium]